MKVAKNFDFILGNVYERNAIHATNEGIVINGKVVATYPDDAEPLNAEELLDTIYESLFSIDNLTGEEKDSVAKLYSANLADVEDWWEDSAMTWEEALSAANESVEKYGYAIAIRKKEDGFYDCTLTHDGKSELYADNYSESELQELIADAWSEIERRLDERIFVVSYVGLCDDEEDADGYNECKAFFSKEKAIAYAKKLKENEVSFLEDEKYEYKVVSDNEEDWRVSWNNGASHVRIFVHECNLEF